MTKKRSFSLLYKFIRFPCKRLKVIKEKALFCRKSLCSVSCLYGKIRKVTTLNNSKAVKFSPGTKIPIQHNEFKSNLVLLVWKTNSVVGKRKSKTGFDKFLRHKTNQPTNKQKQYIYAFLVYIVPMSQKTAHHKCLTTRQQGHSNRNNTDHQVILRVRDWVRVRPRAVVPLWLLSGREWGFRNDTTFWSLRLRIEKWYSWRQSRTLGAISRSPATRVPGRCPLFSEVYSPTY